MLKPNDSGMDFIKDDRVARSYASAPLKFPKVKYNFKQSLKPFQVAGVQLLSEPGNKLLADDMGLGKTAQAIALQDQMNCRTLVLTPASLCLNWQKEFQKFQNKNRTCLVLNSKTFRHVGKLDLDIVIVSYDYFYRENIFKYLNKEFDFKLLILDECHYLKNPKAKRTKFAIGSGGLSSKAQKTIAISGTPMSNRPVELFPILRSLSPHTIDHMGWEEYGFNFCAGFKRKVRTRTGTRFINDFSGASNLDILAYRLRSGFMIRRKKSEVLKQLPNKIKSVIPLQRQTSMGALEIQMLSEFKRSGSLDSVKFKEYAEYLHTLAEKKAPMCIQYINEKIESGVEKMVIFFHHRTMYYHLKRHLPNEECVEIIGDTPAKDRQEAVERFQNDPSAKFFLASITAANTGITLTAANHVVFCEFSFSPGDNEQAVDRCHRIGQENIVFADFLVSTGSLEEAIIEKLLEKDSNIKEVLGEK